MQVPKGWTVRGGIYRHGPLGPRVMVDMNSPDGSVNIRIGDASLPPFALPTRMMLQLGSQASCTASQRPPSLVGWKCVSPVPVGSRAVLTTAHYHPLGAFAEAKPTCVKMNSHKRGTSAWGFHEQFRQRLPP